MNKVSGVTATALGGKRRWLSYIITFMLVISVLMNYFLAINVLKQTQAYRHAYGEVQFHLSSAAGSLNDVSVPPDPRSVTQDDPRFRTLMLELRQAAGILRGLEVAVLPALPSTGPTAFLSSEARSFVLWFEGLNDTRLWDSLETAGIDARFEYLKARLILLADSGEAAKTPDGCYDLKQILDLYLQGLQDIPSPR